MLHRILVFVLSLSLAPLALAQEDANDNPQVIISTSAGLMTVELFADKAPVTVANFLKYVDSGHYEGTIFHRVINNFMIQGGGFTQDLEQKETRAPIVNESKNRLHNVRGTLAMARTADPDSATSQFFINHRNNLRLDWAPGKPGYTVFGKVIDGMYVVDSIASMPTGKTKGFMDVPVEPVFINEIVRVE